MKPLCSVLLGLAVVASPAQGHFVWLLPGTGDEPKATARVIFSEGLRPDDPDLLKKITAIRLSARDADGKTVDLKSYKGKIVLVLVNDPDFETQKGDFGGKAMTYYGRWTYKFEEAARQGALGFLVIHETAPASYG